MSDWILEQRLTVRDLRPGLVGGVRPERAESPRSARNLTLAPLRHWRLRRSTFPGHLAAIRAAEQATGALEPVARKASLERLRAAGHRGPLTPDLAQRCLGFVAASCHEQLGLRPYDVQLHAAWVMLWGGLAQLRTGEGKTLAAGLTAACAGLCGLPVHLLSVNDYLVQRDAATLSPLYSALGLSMGTITADASRQQRRAAYQADITHVNNKEVVFDYLRDQRARGQGLGMGPLSERLRALAPGTGTDPELAPVQRGLCFAIVDEADSILIDEARTPLVLSSEHHARDEVERCSVALGLAQRLELARDFSLSLSQRSAELTEAGRQRLDAMGQALSGQWRNPRLRRELVCLALAALHLYRRDRHYLVQRGRVLLVDDATGRALPDRSLPFGLQQMVELKEGVEPGILTRTLARITNQRFFRRYHHLGATTGTASDCRRELRAIYGLPVVDIPSRLPSRRRTGAWQCFGTVQEQVSWIVTCARMRSAMRRPVLIGTRSVAASEVISKALAEAGIRHQVLNARNDAEEAQVIARAGTAGQVTVATNMAGRGTDIRLDMDASDHGGLHVVVTAINDSQRIQEQLIGRCARGGDPGSYEVALSLGDPAFAEQLPARARRWLYRLSAHHQSLWWQRGMSLLVRALQWTTAARHRAQRRAVLRQETQLEQWLAFTGSTGKDNGT